MSVITILGRWSAHSQQVACRNAMTASTTLAVRRHERLEVQDFLASLRSVDRLRESA